jgi:hypothetical protein
MTYTKAKLKSSGDRASPCFRPFLTENYETDDDDDYNNKYKISVIIVDISVFLVEYDTVTLVKYQSTL